MEGSLRQRGLASWELRVYADIDADTGRPRYRSVTVHGDRADAERALAGLVADVRSTKTIGAQSTMSELFEAWFAIASTSWAPTTTRQTRSVLDRNLHPHLGPHRIGDTTTSLIDNTHATLRRHGGLNGRPLSSGTLARVHVVVRSALAQAVRWGWVCDNPAERAHRITVTTRELHPPTPTELNTLLTHVAARDPMPHVLLVLAATTGARRAQLLALRWDNEPPRL